MTYILNDKVKNLIPYDAVCGEYEVRLDANESFINPGELMNQQILKAVSKIKYNRYPDPMASNLCRSFANFCEVDPANVVAGNGSDELITVILGAFLRPKDRLLTFSPDFSMYRFYGEIYEKTNVLADKEEDLSLNADKVIAKIEETKPEAVLLSNPCSPTSLVMSKEDVLKIVEAADCLVIIDEAYMDFSNQSVIQQAHKYDNLIVLKTCSKALGVAAIRLGFAVSSKSIVTALHSVRSPYNVNAVTQAIGEVILNNTSYIKDSISKIKEARDYLYEGLKKFDSEEKEIKVIKPETNFVFIKLPYAEKVYNELIKRSIIVRKLGEYLRITAGSQEENDKLLLAFSEIIQK